MLKLTNEQANAVLSVLNRTNCKRQEEGGFTPAACRYPVDGLPRAEWCDTCIAKDALAI